MTSYLIQLAVVILVSLPICCGCTERPSSVPAIDEVPKDVRSVSDDDESLRNLLELDDAPSSDSVTNTIPVFHDVAPSAGVRFQRFSDYVPGRYFLPEVMGGGITLFDFDSDGYLDLYATDGCELLNPDPSQSVHINRLFRNGGNGHFTDVTLPSDSGDNRFGQGCASGDFNADGFTDLFVTNYGRNTLLVGNGDGTFSDVTEAAQVGDNSWGTSCVWLDANGDGLADLYVVNYVNLTFENHKSCTYGGIPGYCGPGQWDGVADILYLNQGDETFRIAQGAEGADPKDAKGLAIVVCDFDADQQAEVYVGNDMAPNFLLKRIGESHVPAEPLFQNIAGVAGCAVSGDGKNEASMGVACSDFDNDGNVDIFLTHYYHQKNTLYHNLGSLLFEDNSNRSRISATSFDTLGFGTAAIDVDLDGDEDLFIANGHVLGPEHTPNGMTPQLLENDGKGVFTDLSNKSGEYFRELVIGRGAAKGDFNNDGRVDLAVSHIDRPLAVLRNDTVQKNHFIGIELLASDRTHPAGGRLVVSTEKTNRIIPVISGGSYLSHGDARMVIGLGDYDGAVSITVEWPGRASKMFANLEPDRYWTLVEGQSHRNAISGKWLPTEIVKP